MREPVPAPTASSILANVAQCLQGYLEQPPSGGTDTVVIPRAHLRRWLELVHSATLLLDDPLGASRGIVNALLLVISFALGVLACAVFF